MEKVRAGERETVGITARKREGCMLWRPGYSRLIRSGVGVFWLNLASFWLAFGLGMIFLVYPFVMKSLGASDGMVGLGFGIYMVGYLLGCVFQQRASHRFHPKRSSQMGVRGVLFFVSMMTVVLSFGQQVVGDYAASIMLMILFICCSVCFSCYWPIIMGWVSLGLEGEALNRRLGRYNLSWSSAGILSPLAAGYLVEHSMMGAIGAVVCCYALSLLCLARARYPRETAKSEAAQPVEMVFNKRLGVLRWMAWLAIFSVNLCWGTTRGQLGLYLKMDLGYSESVFGTVIMVMSLTTFLSLYLTGRTKWWHYRLDVYCLLLLSLIGGVTIFMWTQEVRYFYIAGAMVGLAGGFFHSSHVFYRVSGGQRRSSRMALHEIAVGSGFLSGSLSGGYLSDHFGRLMPYRFTFVMVVLSILSQGIVFGIGRRKQRKEMLSQMDQKQIGPGRTGQEAAGQISTGQGPTPPGTTDQGAAGGGVAG